MTTARFGSGNNKTMISPRALALPLDTRFSSAPDETSADLRICTGSGIIREAGDDLSGLSTGDEVIFFVDPTIQIDTHFAPQSTAVDCGCTIKKPAGLSFAQAASLADTYIRAVPAVCAALNTTLDLLFRTDANPQESCTVLLIGGETGLGSAILQVLRRARPHASILTTVSSLEPESDEEHLSSIAIEQILLGGSYSIDHTAPDLLEHLRATLDLEGRSGVDCIIDTMGECGGRGEELQSLGRGGQAKVVDSSKEDLMEEASLLSAPGQSSALGGIARLTASLDLLLRDGAYRLPIYAQIEERKFEDVTSTMRHRANTRESLIVMCS